ncbi:MAG: PaaI family thioesterase, partial [Actinomycetota bacterium]|nr:PaaI family thioesterase [Actinomycetota bacterium]
MSGLEIFIAQMAGELPAPPITHLTGLRPIAADEGTCTFVLPASEWLCSPLARLEGGTIALLADSAISSAVQTTVPPRTSYAPLDLKVNFLRPVAPDGRDLIGKADVVHRGRSIAVANAELRTEDGKSVALATGTAMVLPGRPWSPEPVVPVDETPDDEQA